MNFAVKKIEFEFEENTSTSKKVSFYSLFEIALKKYASKTAFKLEEEGIEFNKELSFITVAKVLKKLAKAGFFIKEIEYEADGTVEVEIE